MLYLNEYDKPAAQWLRNLFPGAVVDERSIVDVRATDLVGFERCHFFAGIGGWELALHLAGVPDDLPVWTGSCPCQPFSTAGRRGGTSDDRHLWPEMLRLVDQCRPVLLFGEQVASRAGRQWLAGVRSDLEALGYAVGAADLCAAGVGAPHIRQRLFWGAVRVGNASRDHKRRDPLPGAHREGIEDRGSGGIDRISNTVCPERQPWPSNVSGVSFSEKRERSSGQSGRSGVSGGFWSRYDVLPFTDGKARRVEPGSFPLVAGLPHGMGYSGDPRAPEYVRNTAEARTMRLRGYGNAIVPQVAAVFVCAFLDSVTEASSG